MNPVAVDQIGGVVIPDEEIRREGRVKRFARKGWALAWRTVIGAALCGSIALGVIALGWSLRLARRWALRGIGADDGRLLPGFVIGDDRGVAWYRWLFAGLWANVKMGVAAAANAWVVTLPAGLLMLFSWYDGWNNSFTKGYEQAWVGPTIGMAGLALFVVAMTYLPMAQARQAVTGRARRFWDYRRVRQVISQRWLACLGLALAYGLAGFVLMVADSALAFAANGRPDIAELPASQLVGELAAYFFYWGIFLFPAFVLLRAWAARIYVGGVRDLVRSGRWGAAEIADEEKPWALAFVDDEPEALHPVVKAAKTTGIFAGRNLARVGAVAIWFGFGAQLYVADFIIHRPVQRWLSQPLVQVPWFRFIPGHLTEAAAEEAKAAVEP